MDLSDGHIRNALKFASNNLNNLQQLVEGDPSFLWVLPKIKGEYVQPNWLPILCTSLESIEFTKDVLGAEMRKFAKQNNLNFGQMMRTLRMLLSSKKDGYQVAEMMEILGRNGTIHRLSRTPDIVDSSKKVGKIN